MADLVPVKRALLSVFDKTGLKEFATALHKEFGVELISTGGTAKFLRDLGLPVTDVSDVTGFPEMMDGRVKTLHPKIHGGLLAIRDNPEHAAAMKAHNIAPIDLVCINLYPFEQTIAKPNVTFDEAIENIDIGGPSMIRSAAKNHRYVLVVTSPDRYEKVLGDLREHNGSTCGKHRLKMAQRAFASTAHYDTLIARYLYRYVTPAKEMIEAPAELELNLRKVMPLRYGENPHQPAALYVDELSRARGPNVAKPIQLHGKDLSYINLLDADAALSCVSEFNRPAACIVKHATPCGAALGADITEAFNAAYAGDPLAAFGGVVALNREITPLAAKSIVEGGKFLEVIVAPAYAADALELLKNRWKNVRLLIPSAGDDNVLPPADGQVWGNHIGGLTMHKILGGYLVQQRDELGVDESNWRVASRRPPTEAEMRDLCFAWLACKHVKSNAIVLATNQMMIGSGAGQQDRVSACRIAIAKAGERAKNSVAASDAFFPFPDGPTLLLDAGVTAIIQPGGSVKDQETIDLVNARGAAMIFTGQRHFKH